MPTGKGPDGVRRRTDADGEMDAERRRHHRHDAISGDLPEIDDDTDDVEGHSFGQNMMLSRNAAQNREREIQRNLRKHELKSEARRPFFKRG